MDKYGIKHYKCITLYNIVVDHVMKIELILPHDISIICSVIQ